MIRKTLLLPVLVAMALLAAPTAVRAAPPSGHARGYSGAFHADPIHSGGMHYAAPHYSYPHYGYHPSYGFYPHSGFRPHTFIWYGGYPYYGSYTYPSYGYYPDYGSTTYYGTGYEPYLPEALAPSSSASASGGQVTSTSSSSPISAGSSAQITVQLPENAEIWFDGMKRDETGSVRTFTTPMLSAGTKYTYEIRARWKEGDALIDQTRNVVFAAGDKLDVTFPVSSGSVEKVKEMTPP